MSIGNTSPDGGCSIVMLVFGEVVASNNVQDLIISQIDLREATIVPRCADAQLACHIDFIVWTITPAVVQCSMVYLYIYIVIIYVYVCFFLICSASLQLLFAKTTHFQLLCYGHWSIQKNYWK